MSAKTPFWLIEIAGIFMTVVCLISKDPNGAAAGMLIAIYGHMKGEAK